ncbi:MAG: hypothetical protein LBT09_13810 [Planctomycetaceae bacterium]|jgi:hypothetical protein|nr:hypothetical protein [Planctomycetaceae bacterium]
MKKLIVLACVVLASVAIIGCGSTASTPTPAPTPGPKPAVTDPTKAGTEKKVDDKKPADATPEKK